jgi:hypothetical protein
VALLRRERLHGAAVKHLPLDGAALEHAPFSRLELVDPGRQQRLQRGRNEDVALRLDEPRHVEADAMRQALVASRAERWSGVRFGGQEPFDALFLWLAYAVDDFCLLTRSRTDQARELVDPASAMGTPTSLGDDSFAYLAYRRVDGADDTYEFGAHGHGPSGAELAQGLCEQVRTWHEDHRYTEARLDVFPAATPESVRSGGCPSSAGRSSRGSPMWEFSQSMMAVALPLS